MVGEITAEEQVERDEGCGALFDEWVLSWLDYQYTNPFTLTRYKNAWTHLSVFLEERGVKHPNEVTYQLCHEYMRVRSQVCTWNTALTELRLHGNQLAGLPDAIGQLTGLKELGLGSNQLTALPESIVALTNLTRLTLENNPPLIRSAQSAAVQAWLQALEDGAACNYPYDEDDDAW